MNKYIWYTWSYANKNPGKLGAYTIAAPGGGAVQIYSPEIVKIIHLIGMPYVLHSKHRCLFFNVTNFYQNLISICLFNCRYFMEFYEMSMVIL